MKRRTGRLILLVLLSFSLVCNDLLASSFLARPGYGVTTGHEFDPLNPDLKKDSDVSNRITVVPPPPAISNNPVKIPSTAKRRPIVVVSPPAEFTASPRAISQPTLIPKASHTEIPVNSRAIPSLIVKPPKLPIVVGRPLSTPPPRGPKPIIVLPPDPVIKTVNIPAAPSQKATGLIVVSPVEGKTAVVQGVQMSPVTVVAPSLLFTPAPSEVPAMASTAPVTKIVHESTTSPTKGNVAGIGERSPVVDESSATAGQGSTVYGISNFDSGLHIETTNLLGITVEPGKSFAVGFRVTNISGKPGNFIEEFDMPQGFELVFPPAEFSLEPMESFNSIVMVSVPNYLPAGEHQFTYNVYNSNDQSVHGNLSFRFNIMELVDLKFIIEEQPSSVIDGENFIIKGKLFNNSNASFAVALSMTRQKHFKISVEPTKASLAPGAFVDLQIEGKTGFAKRMVGLNSVLVVQDTSKPNGRVLLRQNVGLNFFTHAGEKIDFTKRLPVVVTTRLEGYSKKVYSRYEVSGSGKLDSQGKRRIDFMFKEKTIKEGYRISTKNEEIKVLYQDNNAVVKYGDHSFGISNIIPAYHGRGLGVDYALNQKTSVGVLGFRRGENIPLEGKGFYVSHVLNDITVLRFNYFATESEKYPLSPDEKFSTLGLTLRPDSTSSLSGEVGRKWGGTLTDKESLAYSIGYTKHIRRMAVFNVSHNSRGVVYGGSMIGTENTSTSLNVPIRKNLDTSLVYYTSKQKPVVVDENSSASQADSYQAKINYRVSNSRDIFVAYANEHRFDWLGARYDEREKNLQTGISQTIRNMRFYYSLNRKNLVDWLNNTDRWFTVHNVNTTLRTGYNLMFSTYANFSKYRGESSATLPDSNNFGVAVDWSILENFQMRLNYSENYRENTGKANSNFGLNFSYNHFNTNVNFGVNKVQTPGISKAPLYYELIVSQKLGIPVSRNIQIGALTGIVTEKVGSQSAPVANVALLINNFAAVTDSKGRYVFGDLMPGTYTLDIDRRAAAISKISSVGLPVSVYIAGARLAVFDIQLEEGCRLSGGVKVSGKPSQGPTALKHLEVAKIFAPLPVGVKALSGEILDGVVIELRQNNKVYTSSSDALGRFVFPAMESGNWSYRVISNSIPQGYQIDRSEGSVRLTPEAEQKIEFTVSAIERVIEMVGGD